MLASSDFAVFPMPWSDRHGKLHTPARGKIRSRRSLFRAYSGTKKGQRGRDGNFQRRSRHKGPLCDKPDTTSAEAQRGKAIRTDRRLETTVERGRTCCF